MSSLTFTKLFSSITDSSVWQESNETRLVWITMLAMADPVGRIHAAIPGLAHRARVSVKETELAIEVFLSPDPYSRTEDNEGRRIEKIQGGWRLLNYQVYRELRDDEVRKAQNREAKERQRQKEKELAESMTPSVFADSQQESANVSKSQQNQPRSAQVEVEVEAEVKKPARTKREADVRFTPFRELLAKAWAVHNSIDMPWGKDAGANLARLLSNNPKLTAEEFRIMLHHRHKSESVNLAERPMAWISKITDYAKGPLNQFNRPLDKADAAFKPVNLLDKIERSLAQ